MNPITPTIGRIVLFATLAGAVVPGIVTKIHDDESIIDIVTFGEENVPASFHIFVAYDNDTPDGFNATTRRVGTWAWMPYQKQQAAKGAGDSLEAIRAGVVYAFMGWLTTREGVSGPFSGNHEASSAADLAGAFVKAQGWDNANPAIPEWKSPDTTAMIDRSISAIASDMDPVAETDVEYAARLDREHPLDSPEHAFEITKPSDDIEGQAATVSVFRSLRKVTGHEVNPCNTQIMIGADEPGAGGASHEYSIFIGGKAFATIAFQNGPVNEDGNGVNGLTQEVLLTIVADRLEAFQNGPYANKYNAAALDSVLLARENLLQRTRERMSRGVEGTHQV